MKKLLPYKWVILLITISLIFFHNFLVRGLIPIPADALVGLYHPFRDLYSSTFERGMPFKNPLITDPIVQIYPWKELAVEMISTFQIPFWNPYEMAGKPLLGNFQSSPLYPLNILLLMGNFQVMWGVFILIQPLLSGLFLYLYLRNLSLDPRASIFGGLAFSFSGFFTVWLEWGTIGHTVLWLPLLLLSTDKLFYSFTVKDTNNSKFKIQNLKLQFKIQNIKFSAWSLVFLFSLVSSFFAGHLQMFFYTFIFCVSYLAARWIQYKRNIKLLFIFGFYFLLFFIFTAVQWIPTLQFILQSARSVDQTISIPGWFMPWENLIQFIAPDFFGNPATGNYWGTWNYGELVGYFGIVSFAFAIYAVINRQDKKTLLFFIAGIVALIFSLPHTISYLPFWFSIPFISSAQPTRLLYIVTFSFSILSALGFDLHIREKKPLLSRNVAIFVLFIVFSGLWVLTLVSDLSFFKNIENIEVARRNLVFPTIIFCVLIFLYIIKVFTKNILLRHGIILCFIFLLIVELFRFGDKFLPFSDRSYIFPSSKIISYLQSDKNIYRVASMDRRILPPNVLTHYRIQTIEGYDPLYLQSYGEFVAALERGEANISPPFGFNRIITPHNIDSKLFKLLNVKYLLSLSDIYNPEYKLILREGETRLYENTEPLPRAYFVKSILTEYTKEDIIKRLYDPNFDINSMAVVEVSSNSDKFTGDLKGGTVMISEYLPNKIILKTQSDTDGFLVLLDSYYPTWNAILDGGENLEIHKTNYAFRGIIVPKGIHTIVFYDDIMY